MYGQWKHLNFDDMESIFNVRITRKKKYSTGVTKERQTEFQIGGNSLFDNIVALILVILVILKLTEVISCSWWMVFSPLLVYWVILTIVDIYKDI